MPQLDSQITETSTTRIEAKQVLDAIDWELRLRGERDKRPGWSQWALAGGLAAIAWSIAGRYASIQSASICVLTALVCWYVYVILRILHAYLAAPSNSLLPKEPKFDRANESIANSRVRLLFHAGVGVSFCLYRPWWTPNSWPFSGVVLLSFLIGVILALAVLLIKSFSQLPELRVARSSSRWPDRVMAAGGLGLLVILFLYGLLGHALSTAVWAGATGADVQIGLLLFALGWIGEALCKLVEQDPWTLRLVQLHRDLAFSRITPSMAMASLIHIIEGMTPVEFTTESRAQLKERTTRLRAAIVPIKEGLENVVAMQARPNLTLVERQVAAEAACSLNERLKRLHTDLAAVESAAETLLWQSLHLRSAGASTNQTRSIRQEVRDEIKALKNDALAARAQANKALASASRGEESGKQSD
jgi:hypothetical protein